MQYIWEVVLAAEKNGIREADLRYEVAEVRSPYLEVSFSDLNTQTVEQTVVEVNPFYRFFDIFSEILDINQKEYEKTREIFVDTVFHYLALTDLRMGMSKKDYYLKFLAEELGSGQFGSKAKAAMRLFSRYEKRYLVLALMDVVASRNYLEIFKWLFQEIYINSMIYISMDLSWKCRDTGRQRAGSVFIRHLFANRYEDRSLLSGTFWNPGYGRNHGDR